MDQSSDIYHIHDFKVKIRKRRCLDVEFKTKHVSNDRRRKYRYTSIPWSCNRIPRYLDRMCMLTTLCIKTERSTVITDELRVLKALTTLKMSGDFVLTDRSLMVTTLKSLTLTDMNLHTVDLNRSLRTLGRLDSLNMRGCLLPRDYTLDCSGCTQLRSIEIRWTRLYGMPILEECSVLNTVYLKECHMYSDGLHDTDLGHVHTIKIVECGLSASIPEWCSRVHAILIKDTVDLMGLNTRYGYYRVYNGA